MENASKALIMAGSVLIALLVISLIVVGYGQISEWQQTVDDTEQVATDTEYMLQIEQFNRDLYGSELLSLMNFVENYNAREAGDGYSPIQLNITIRNGISDSFDYFKAGNYDIDRLYDEVKGSNGIETEIEKYEEPDSRYNNKSVEYYWSKTYRQIAQEFELEIPSNTPTSDLENVLLELAREKGIGSRIQDLLDDIAEYDLLNSIYTQFREGKIFSPAEDNGFIYDEHNGRVIEINFVERTY